MQVTLKAERKGHLYLCTKAGGRADRSVTSTQLLSSEFFFLLPLLLHETGYGKVLFSHASSSRGRNVRDLEVQK